MILGQWQHNNAHIQSRKTRWNAFVRDFSEHLFRITELFCSVSSVARQHQQGGPHRLQPVSSGHHGIFNSGCVEATAACQGEASWITYSAIWPQEVITRAKVMVNFIRLPGDLSGTPFAVLPQSPSPLLIIIPPPTIHCEQMSGNYIICPEEISWCFILSPSLIQPASHPSIYNVNVM